MDSPPSDPDDNHAGAVALRDDTSGVLAATTHRPGDATFHDEPGTCRPDHDDADDLCTAHVGAERERSPRA